MSQHALVESSLLHEPGQWNSLRIQPSRQDLLHAVWHDGQIALAQPARVNAWNADPAVSLTQEMESDSAAFLRNSHRKIASKIGLEVQIALKSQGRKDLG